MEAACPKVGALGDLGCARLARDEASGACCDLHIALCGKSYGQRSPEELLLPRPDDCSRRGCFQAASAGHGLSSQLQRVSRNLPWELQNYKSGISPATAAGRHICLTPVGTSLRNHQRSRWRWQEGCCSRVSAAGLRSKYGTMDDTSNVKVLARLKRDASRKKILAGVLLFPMATWRADSCQGSNDRKG